MNTLQWVIHSVIKWGVSKGILAKDPINNPDNHEKQTLKLVAEVGELADEIAKGNYDKAKMELGDVLVTTILLADLLGATIEECLHLAYEKISKRTGKTVNGVFIKDDD